MSAAEIQAIDSTSFNAYMANAIGAVLIDFWAPWCAPCRALAPHLEHVANQFASQLQVGKVNVDVAPDLAGRFGVRGVPTLILFKHGEPQAQLVGLHSEKELSAWLESAL